MAADRARAARAFASLLRACLERTAPRPPDRKPHDDAWGTGMPASSNSTVRQRIDVHAFASRLRRLEEVRPLLCRDNEVRHRHGVELGRDDEVVLGEPPQRRSPQLNRDAVVGGSLGRGGVAWTMRAWVSSQTRRPACNNAPSAVASWVMRPDSSFAAAASLACHTRLQSRRSARPHDVRRTAHSPQARVVLSKLPVEHLCQSSVSPTPRQQTAMRAPACETALRPCTAAAARQPQAACT